MNITHLDPRIWGPTFWFVLHLLTLGYPTHPNSVTKKKYYDFFQHQLPVFLPIENISKDFTELLNTYPVSPYLDSQESLVKWMVFIHNKINKKLEKPEITLADFYQLYAEKILPPEQRYWEKKRFYEKFGFFLLSIICLLIFFVII